MTGNSPARTRAGLRDRQAAWALDWASFCSAKVRPRCDVRHANSEKIHTSVTGVTFKIDRRVYKYTKVQLGAFQLETVMNKQEKTDDSYVTISLRLGRVIQLLDLTFLRWSDPVLGWRAIVRETRSKPGHAGINSPPSP